MADLDLDDAEHVAMRAEAERLVSLWRQTIDLTREENECASPGSLTFSETPA